MIGDLKMKMEIMAIIQELGTTIDHLMANDWLVVGLGFFILLTLSVWIIRSWLEGETGDGAVSPLVD